MAQRLIDEIALSRQIQSEYHGAISDSEMKVYQVLQRLEAAPTVDAVPRGKVTKMAKYVPKSTAKTIICDLCSGLHPDEPCPLKCDWMAMLDEEEIDVVNNRNCYGGRNDNDK